MAELGIVVAMIDEAGSPDPEVIEQAVSDWLDDHPEATCPIDDTAGEGDTGKVWSADKSAEEVSSLTEAIENVLIENTSESITLANVENVSDFYGHAGASNGFTTDALADGVASYRIRTNSTEKNPYFRANCAEGSGTWLVGMKFKIEKLDPTLGDPSDLRVVLANSDSTDFEVVYDEWVNYADVFTGDLTRVDFYARGYAVAPQKGQVEVYVKDVYVYEVSQASADMIAYIKTQQASNYQDGTVTYTVGGGQSGFVPDTTLTEEGKCADSKAVGDAISNAVKPPLDNNLQGVAFGTSLTSRSALGNPGYLTYLPDLIGIEFDNQGIGSAQIKNSILNAIKGYTGYANKSVCIIEGFVNDWNMEVPLGTWKDTTETTACGCLRSAINYVFSQNANITMFIVVDHYGRDNQGSDRSSTALNEDNLTQYEYYEELVKVAESLGIPVIKQYAESQISENTPQFLADYIHLNELGAKQSANFIYSKMKKYFQNEQPSS